MTRAQQLVIVACLALAAGIGWQYGAPWVQEHLAALSVHIVSGETAYIVRDTSKDRDLPAEIVAAINSQKLADDCQANNVTLYARCDAKVDERMPAEMKSAIALAAKDGLPRLVIRAQSGRTSDVALPKTEAELRRAIGI
jgi:hypothetical protein